MKEYGPFGVALRGEASNRLMLRWLKTVVVSDEEKVPRKVPGRDQEGERKRIVEEVSKEKTDGIETGVLRVLRDEPGGCPPTGQVVPGMEATRA
jgi:hypothetical protein